MCGHSLICKKIKALVLALLMLALFQIYLALCACNILACVLFYIIQLVLYCCFSCLIIEYIMCLYLFQNKSNKLSVTQVR